MKVLTAFDSFKGCLSARQACDVAARSWRRRFPAAEVVCLPLSDGGEGMVDCIAEALPVVWVQADVHGPLMEPLTVRYAVSPDGQTAYLEMAMAAGLPLVPPGRRNPLLTTTYGVGELLLDAARRGCRKVVMGIGGSATCDGGAGMIECLRPYLPLPVEITVASDVTNPLYGPEGAAYVFAPQKGASPGQVAELDLRLRQWEQETVAAGYDDGHIASHPGAGAAGGLGYALLAYLGATLRSGIDLVLDAIHFDQHLAGADVVLTGEGQSDRQTLMGKVPMGVLRRARAHHVPVRLLSGAVSDVDALLQAGFSSVMSINRYDHRPLAVLLQPAVAMHNLAHTILLTAGPVQRLTLDGGFSCPNRDGRIGSGGCTFCRPDAFVPGYCRESHDLASQLAEGKRFFARKHRSAAAYLAYFQANTSTYDALPALRRRYMEVFSDPEVIGIVIGTRPDCLSDEVLDLLAEIHLQHPVMVEIGVESCHDRTLLRIHRGHDFACTADAIRRTAARGIPVGVHMIVGLPGETEADVLRAADILSALPVSSVKLHQLQVLEGTPMADEWRLHPEDFLLRTPQQYADLVASFLSRLRADIHVERFAASAPLSLVLAPRWGLKPAEIQALCTASIRKRETPHIINSHELIHEFFRPVQLD